MLTPQEESILKRLAAENTPMTRLPVKHGERRVVDMDAWLQREFAKCEKIQTVDPEQDWAVINQLRDAGVLGKKERLMEFFARTLIGRAQILTMTKDELKRAVALADARNADDGGYRPPQVFCEPQARPVARRVPIVMVGE